MERVKNWAMKLNIMMNEAKKKEFKRAEHDCLIWVANVIEELTGKEEILSFFRGSYDSYKEAIRLSREYCDEGAGMVDTMEKCMDKHGFEKIENMDMAKRGDVILFPGGLEGVTVGICMGQYVYTLSKEKGLSKRSMDVAIKGWHI